jgi:hypothetical protein
LTWSGRFPALASLDQFVEVVISEHAARPFLAATEVDIFHLAVPNESVQLLDTDVQPFGGFLRGSQNTHYTTPHKMRRCGPGMLRREVCRGRDHRAVEIGAALRSYHFPPTSNSGDREAIKTLKAQCFLSSCAFTMLRENR